MQKRLLFLLLAVLLLVSPAKAVELSAKSALLMEPVTGSVLFEENADDPRLVASTTKLMTCLVALDSCALTERVTVPPEAVGVEGSSMHLAAGETLSLETLLMGLLLDSGNDAAVAVALHVAGSVEAFAARMNERAALLGCEKTHFTNPHGLDDGENHLSTARDLARIMAACLADERIVRLLSTESATAEGHSFTNHNRLLTECAGVFAGKTGYTRAAGRTLVTACRREGMTLICVTLSDPDDWADHAALYDWGFAEKKLVWLEKEAALPLISGETASALVTTGEPHPILLPKEAELTEKISLPPFAYAPARAGERAGQASWFLEGEEVYTAPLRFEEDAALNPAKKSSLWRDLWKRDYKKSSPPVGS